jgi:MFS family permease
MALAPSIVTFALASALMGLALSIYHPAGTALLTHAVAVSGRVFAVHGMAGNLGVAGAGAIAGVLGALVGWRLALGLVALGGVTLGFFALALPAASLAEIRARPGRGRRAELALLLGAVLFTGMVYRGVTTFLPKHLASGLAGDAGVAIGGALTTAALLVGVAGMWVAGRIADAGVRGPRLFLMATLLQVPFLVALGWAPPAARLPAAMGLAFFHFFTQPPGNQMVAEFTPSRLRGLGYGLYFFVTFGVGSLGAALGGWVSERFGLAQAFPALAVLLVPAIAASAWLALRTPTRRARTSLDVVSGRQDRT